MAVLVGTVVDSAGSALAGVALTFTERGGADRTSTKTGDDGTFTTRVVEAGTYGFLARLDGFVDHRGEVADVPAGDGQERIERFAVFKPASIFGRVLDAAGVPVVGAEVRTVKPDRLGPFRVNVDGGFVIVDLPPATWVVRVDPPPGFGPVPDREVDLPEGDRTEVGFELPVQTAEPEPEPAGPAVSGTVTDGGGVGVAGATVAARPARGDPFEATTGAGGEYRIAGLPAGTYSVGVTAPDPGTYLPAANVSVSAGRTTAGIDFSADPVLDYLGRLDDDRSNIESRVSSEEARAAATLFSVAALLLAGRDSTAPAGRVDVLGVLRLHDGLQDRAFLDRLKVPQSAVFWAPLIPAINDLYRLLDQRQREVTALASEAKRQFNLGPSNGVLANIAFPGLFRRYVALGADPLLTLDLDVESDRMRGGDPTRLAEADALLAELKGVIVALVRMLSEYGSVGTVQLSADWAMFGSKAMEVIATLAQHRVDPDDVDSLSQWAVLADVTGTDRGEAIAPYVALARHGRRLLELAIDVYEDTAADLERFDPTHLRDLFQAGTDRSAYWTTRIGREAVTVARYPLRRW